MYHSPGYSASAANMMSKNTRQRRFSNNTNPIISGKQERKLSTGSQTSIRERRFSYTWPESEDKEPSPSPKSSQFTFPIPGSPSPRPTPFNFSTRQHTVSESSTVSFMSSSSSDSLKTPGDEDEVRSPFSPVFGKTPKFY